MAMTKRQSAALKRLRPVDDNGRWYWPVTRADIARARRLAAHGVLIETTGVCEGCEHHRAGHHVPVFKLAEEI